MTKGNLTPNGSCRACKDNRECLRTKGTSKPTLRAKTKCQDLAGCIPLKRNLAPRPPQPPPLARPYGSPTATTTCTAPVGSIGTARASSPAVGAPAEPPRGSSGNEVASWIMSGGLDYQTDKEEEEEEEEEEESASAVVTEFIDLCTPPASPVTRRDAAMATAPALPLCCDGVSDMC